MKRLRALFALPLVLLATEAVASAQRARAELRPHVQSWRNTHGKNWRVVRDAATGNVRFLWGGSANLGAPALGGIDYFALGRQAVLATAGMHGVQESTLADDSEVFLPLATVGTTDKTTVRFTQEFDGVPVNEGSVNVLFDQHGRMLSIDATALPNVTSFDTAPVLTALQAEIIAGGFFSTEEGVAATDISDARLRIDQVDSGGTKVGKLVWEVDTLWSPEHVLAVGHTYRVDANDGTLVSQAALVHTFDVSGKVEANATPGHGPDRPPNVPVIHPMPYIYVTDGVTSVQTDEAGNFTHPADPPVSLTVQFLGDWANSFGMQSGSHSVTELIDQETGNVITLNAVPAQVNTSQANAFLWINELRTWILSINPTNNIPNQRIRARCNHADACNAYYDGSSVNFFVDTAACPNSSYSSVILHESGHHLNVRYGSGNGQDGFGEGNADVFSMYLLDDPVVGEGFLAGLPIRDGRNTRQLCPDDSTSCYDGVHTKGEVLMGALWKVRESLESSLGSVAGEATADQLFISWMNAYDQRGIRPNIVRQWLTLDDNDGNINTGTPNNLAIQTGFLAQGFPGIRTGYYYAGNKASEER